MTELSIDDIELVLPQTQCGQCSYNGCRPYATAIIEQGEAINRCPPGGIATLLVLAQKLVQDATPLLADMAQRATPPALAHIREADCIGCTKCIQACPVDAIVGAAKQMHTIITDECTGCGLCVAPCPVDCIDLETIPERQYNPERARLRYLARQARKLPQQKIVEPAPFATVLGNNVAQTDIQAAVARAKASREAKLQAQKQSYESKKTD